MEDCYGNVVKPYCISLWILLMLVLTLVWAQWDLGSCTLHEIVSLIRKSRGQNQHLINKQGQNPNHSLWRHHLFDVVNLVCVELFGFFKGNKRQIAYAVYLDSCYIPGLFVENIEFWVVPYYFSTECQNKEESAYKILKYTVLWTAWMNAPVFQCSDQRWQL